MTSDVLTFHFLKILSSIHILRAGTSSEARNSLFKGWTTFMWEGSIKLGKNKSRSSKTKLQIDGFGGERRHFCIFHIFSRDQQSVMSHNSWPGPVITRMVLILLIIIMAFLLGQHSNKIYNKSLKDCLMSSSKIIMVVFLRQNHC